MHYTDKAALTKKGKVDSAQYSALKESMQTKLTYTQLYPIVQYFLELMQHDNSTIHGYRFDVRLHLYSCGSRMFALKYFGIYWFFLLQKCAVFNGMDSCHAHTSRTTQ